MTSVKCAVCSTFNPFNIIYFSTCRAQGKWECVYHFAYCPYYCKYCMMTHFMSFVLRLNLIMHGWSEGPVTKMRTNTEFLLNFKVKKNPDKQAFDIIILSKACREKVCSKKKLNTQKLKHRINHDGVLVGIIWQPYIIFHTIAKIIIVLTQAAIFMDF